MYKRTVLTIGMVLTLLYTQMAFSEGTWEVIQQPFGSRPFDAVQFVDAERGWVVGVDMIAYTQNGGKKWEVQFFDDKYTLLDVYFIDPKEGWVVGIKGRGGVILHTIDAGKNWKIQLNVEKSYLRSVDFIDDLEGWVVGSDGLILHTTDAGKTWTPQNSGTAEQLVGVDFIDEQHGWVVGDAGTILHTDDGGITWQKQNSGTAAWLNKVQFLDENNGWVIGQLDAILHTTDGGKNWQRQKMRDVFFGICFINLQEGWLVGSKRGPGPSILHTKDGGKTWEEQDAGVGGLSRSLWDVYFLDEKRGWAVGQFGAILHTKNDGRTWKQQKSPIIKFFEDVLFVNRKEGWVIGPSGDILHTQDGGENWEVQDSHVKNSLFDICYDGDMTLWVVGSFGVILKYTDPDLKPYAFQVKKDQFLTTWGRLKNVLYQNYPNPFNPETWIPFRLSVGGDVTISIYNVKGKLIRKLNLGYKLPGTYFDKSKAAYWDGRTERGEEAASGIYFYQIKTGRFTDTKKALLMK